MPQGGMAQGDMAQGQMPQGQAPGDMAQGDMGERPQGQAPGDIAQGQLPMKEPTFVLSGHSVTVQSIPIERLTGQTLQISDGTTVYLDTELTSETMELTSAVTSGESYTVTLSAHGMEAVTFTVVAQ